MDITIAKSLVCVVVSSNFQKKNEEYLLLLLMMIEVLLNFCSFPKKKHNILMAMTYLS